MRIVFTHLPGMGSFIDHIVKHFQSTGHDVRVVVGGDSRPIQEAIDWCDLLWLEWCDRLTAEILTKLKPMNKRVMCRLHSFEAFEGFPKAIGLPMNMIDDLIFVAPHIQRIVRESFPDIDRLCPKQHIVPNGIDVDKFALAPERPEHRIGYLGYINGKKGGDILLPAFEHIVRATMLTHASISLTVAGTIQEKLLAEYFTHYTERSGLIHPGKPAAVRNFRMVGWVDNVVDFVNDMRYILNTSNIEASPVGLMEAMSTGCIPLIHSFIGSDRMFPREWIWHSFDELVDRLNDDTPIETYRQFIVDNYSADLQLARLDSIIKNGGTTDEHIRTFPNND